MTRVRKHGEDTPFGQWLREHPDLDSRRWDLNVSDADWFFQKFRTNVDAVGTRDVQLAMFVETKVLDGYPSDAQQEILFYHHQRLCKKGWVKRVNRSPIMLWHYGVFVLRMPGMRPDDNTYVHWGRFGPDGHLRWDRGSANGLHKLLRFDVDPSTYKSISLRRHHKTRDIVQVTNTPLGFEVEERITKHS